MMQYVYLVLPVLLVIVLTQMFKVLREYERGVIFMLGRFWKVKGPGLIILIPFVQQIVRVDLRTIVMDVPTQDVISRDNVSVKVNGNVQILSNTIIYITLPSLASIEELIKCARMGY